ncbi:hypothetical protein [Phormidium tenue]|uniref:Uncharacterized protein n=1 Tax=Phormidium tenue NIES-30 TaxID=549789 RepID=A0A1U7J0C7_9CYAN|nr:hypothetical protein [Phormidium tenue]MBD2234302.1 hypothetical protein [Phormidium tenue FACHB-1052]OKH44953.1 hypothetical protein NIES30_20895 [Phormidium tenue NIES-30]
MGSACPALVKERSQRATSDSMEGNDFCVYLSNRPPDGDRLLPLCQHIATGHIQGRVFGVVAHDFQQLFNAYSL